MLKNLIYLVFFISIKFYSQSFINEAANYIENNTVLSTLHHKLNTNQRASILHIGDSHIQANYMTGRLRERFQENYGNSGRGIVFPMRLLHTNGHSDFLFSSDINWKGQKITDKNNSTCGFSGASISTTKPKFRITLKNNTDHEITTIHVIGKGLSKLKFYTLKKNNLTPRKYIKVEDKPQIYKVKQGDILGKIARRFNTSVAKIKTLNNLESDRINIDQYLKINNNNTTYKPIKINTNDFDYITPYYHTDNKISIQLEKSIEELNLISEEKAVSSYTKIDGIILNNDYKNGVIYHSVGLNSAKFSDYTKSNLFFEQLKNITPDLIILSLGTNESFYNNLNETKFRTDVNLFLDKLNANTNCKNIILTTPPSSLKKRNHINKNLAPFTNTLIDVAKRKNLGSWNLFELTGKENGIQKWYSKGLASKDKIHYSKSGYIVQADMLFEALLKNISQKNLLNIANKK